MESKKTLTEQLIEISRPLPLPYPAAQGKKAELAQSLWIQYIQACENYLQQSNAHPYLKDILHNPFVYFYVKKTAKSKVYTCFPIPNKNGYPTNNLTQKSFRFLLENLCLAPFLHGPLYDNLFHSLCALLENFPYTPIQLFMEEIKRYDPEFASRLYAQPFFYFSIEKNIYFGRSIPYLLQPLQSALKLDGKTGVPSRVLRRYLFALAKESQALQKQLVFIEDDLPELCLIYQYLPRFFTLQYQPENDSFSSGKYAPKVSIKAVPLRGSEKLICVSNTIASFFHTIFSSDTHLMSQFALFLARAYSPNKSGLTIIYTPCVEMGNILRISLMQIFPSLLVTKSIDRNPFHESLNKLTKSQYLKDLFLQQDDGKCIVLVKDTPPSDSSIARVRRLVKGKSIPIKSDFLPNQHFFNKMHFICITSDDKAAQTMQKKLKAHRINFPACAPEAVALYRPFSSDDILWFHTVFLPYGLKLLTLKERKLPDPSPFQSEPALPVPSPTEEVEHFLHTCCKFQEGAFSDTHEVYRWYEQFIQAIHPGQKIPLTKIVFNKRLREYLPKFHGGKVAYRRNHYSRGERFLYCYMGLALSSLPSPDSHPQEASHDLLEDYLTYIDRYRIELPNGLQVQVTGGDVPRIES